MLMLAIVAVLLALAVWGYMEGRKELAKEREREQPVKAPSRLSVQEGEITVSLDQETRTKAGIAVVSLQTVIRRQEIQAYGTVLPPQGLIELRNNLAAAEAQVEKTRVALQASRQEYERLKALNRGETRNVSEKMLQAAEAVWRADEASADAAQEALTAIGQGARQTWGPALTKAVQTRSPLFERFAQQQEALLRMTIPAGLGITHAPRTARIQAPDGRFETAMFISPSPQTDSRLQGMSFFYSAPASRLLPGMTLTGYLSSGPEMQGVIIPADAVVWWQGKAWVYVQRQGNRFERRELPTDNPTGQGWFAAKGFDNTRVVVKGAQLLLSEELRSQIQVGEEGEKK
jgi:hypothetical protein